MKTKLKLPKLYTKNKIFKMLVEENEGLLIINFIYSFQPKEREKIKKIINYFAKCNLINIKKAKTFIAQEISYHGYENRVKKEYIDAKLDDAGAIIFITDKGKEEYKKIKTRWKWWLNFLFTALLSALISAIISLLFKIN